MSYVELISLYTVVSIPFMVSVFIQLFMLFCKGEALPLTVRKEGSEGELMETIKEVKDLGSLLPHSIFSLIMGICAVIASTLKGFFWVYNPVHSIRGLLELMSWEFKELS